MKNTIQKYLNDLREEIAKRGHPIKCAMALDFTYSYLMVRFDWIVENNCFSITFPLDNKAQSEMFLIEAGFYPRNYEGEKDGILRWSKPPFIAKGARE